MQHWKWVSVRTTILQFACWATRQTYFVICSLPPPPTAHESARPTRCTKMLAKTCICQQTLLLPLSSSASGGTLLLLAIVPYQEGTSLQWKWFTNKKVVAWKHVKNVVNANFGRFVRKVQVQCWSQLNFLVALWRFRFV